MLVSFHTIPLLTIDLQLKLFTHQLLSNDGGWFVDLTTATILNSTCFFKVSNKYFKYIIYNKQGFGWITFCSHIVTTISFFVITIHYVNIVLTPTVGVQGSSVLLYLYSIGPSNPIGHKLWLPSYVRIGGWNTWGFPNFEATEISKAILENEETLHSHTPS